jgi:hypothetical protein
VFDRSNRHVQTVCRQIQTATQNAKNELTTQVVPRGPNDPAAAEKAGKNETKTTDVTRRLRAAKP